MSRHIDSNGPGAKGFASLPPATDSNGSGTRESYTFLLPAVEADEVGRLGNYRVLRPLGRGGMAYVFLAEDITLRRRVALKVMDPSLAGEADSVPRFLREARLMAAIKHDHLVTVYQVEQQGKVAYLAMELLEGEPLEAWMNRCRRSDVGEIVRLGREIASGLEVIHRHGLIHRDIKPANIWLEGPQRRVKILDFGLARFIDDDAHLTQSGTVMGTPAFMAPEQARAEKVDARCDLFSLGCVLYCLCTGTKPFRGANTLAVLTALAVDHPPHVRELNPDVPAALGDLVMHLLAKKPEQRPASSAEVIARLSEVGPFADTLARQLPPAAAPPAGSTPPPASPSATRVLGPSSTGKPGGSSTIILSHPWLRWGFPAALGVLALTVVVAKLVVGSAGSSAPTNARATSAATQPAGVRPTAGAVAGKAFLSDMQEISPVNFPMMGFVPGMELEPGDGPRPKGGMRIRHAGVPSPHGIFMHAPPPPPPGIPPAPESSRVSTSYRLGKQYRTFHAEVSQNDGPPPCEPMVFLVYTDGKERWRSKEVTSSSQTHTCHLAINDVDLLKLEVRYLGDARGAHAAWIEPYVEK